MQIMIFHDIFRKNLLLLTIGIFIGVGQAYPDTLSSNSSLTSPSDLISQNIARREVALKKALTPSDSIKILLDIYSLSDKLNRDRIRTQLINLAQRSDNHEVIGTVLNELSTTTDDTKDLARLIEISENLPEDTTKDNIQTVLKMEQAQAEAPSVEDSVMENEVAEYARQGMAIGTDPYKEIQNIYRVMTYLGTSSQGPLYFEYIKRLGELVEALPESDYAIKNLYYTTAAIFYTRKRDYKKAIEFDRKLISQLNNMQKRYSDPEKAKADLDYFYYVSYRRMLRNFKGLTPAEIEDAYRECVRLAQENLQAGEEFGNGGLTNSYYYMATGQYAKAVPELRKALSQPDISDFRKAELLGHLGYALRQTGDTKGELETLRAYTAMLLKDRSQRRDDMYKEIELRNSVNKLLMDEYKEEQQQRSSNQVMRKTALTLVYVLALILIFMCQAYFRLRGKVKDLEIRNKRLHKDFENIFDDGAPKGSMDLRHKNHGLKG